jgi:predicted nucleic acid-binding protein
MIVVDTCIVTHLFNQTEMTHVAQELLGKNPYWCIPTLWREEYANVLVKLLKKSKVTANQVVELFESTCAHMKDFEYRIETVEALRSAIEYQISVYDAHFVALAKQLDICFVTEDREVVKKCEGCALTMREYLDLEY